MMKQCLHLRHPFAVYVSHATCFVTCLRVLSIGHHACSGSLSRAQSDGSLPVAEMYNGPEDEPTRVWMMSALVPLV
jgi:hypothetical protein